MRKLATSENRQNAMKNEGDREVHVGIGHRDTQRYAHHDGHSPCRQHQSRDETNLHQDDTDQWHHAQRIEFEEAAQVILAHRQPRRQADHAPQGRDQQRLAPGGTTDLALEDQHEYRECDADIQAQHHGEILCHQHHDRRIDGVIEHEHQLKDDQAPATHYGTAYPPTMLELLKVSLEFRGKAQLRRGRGTQVLLQYCHS